MATVRQIYNAGRSARESGGNESLVPYGKAQLKERAFWLAGWHDADIEISGKRYYKPEGWNENNRA